MGSLRGRHGYAMDRIHFYAKGGWAYSRYSSAFGNSDSGVSLSGYAAGAGVEYNVSSNMSVKFEGMYVDLADTTVHGEDPGAFPGETIDYRFKNNVFLGKIGLNFGF